MSEDKSPDVYEDAAEDEDLDPEELKKDAGGYNHNSMIGTIVDYIIGKTKDSDQTGGATGTW